MSERRKASAKNRTLAYIGAAVVHLVIIAAMLLNFTSDDKFEKVDAFDAEKIDTVKASVIDESQIKDQQEKIKQAERERERKKREKREREQRELDKIKKQADQEKKKVADLKVKQEAEKKKAAELEKQRKAIALKKKKEEERRKKEEKIAKQKAEAEKKRIADLQKQLAKEEAELLERQRLNKLLAEEEAELQRQEAARRAKQRTTTLVSKFFSGIKRKIEIKRTVDPSFETWRKSVVDITLSPSGAVKSVRTIQSSGLPLYDQSVETAIYAASPFDMPDQNQEPDAVQRLLNIELEVFHPNARR